MSASTVPVKNVAFVFEIALVSQADTKLYQSNPTLAAGDVKVQTDDGTLANITTLPTGAASSKRVKVSLSAAEMNGDNVWVQFVDAAGAEWCDYAVCIQTSARGVDDLAYPTTTGRSIDVTTTGEVGLDLANTTAIDTYTLLQAMRVLLADAAGKSSGSLANAPVLRAIDDSKARITATVDADGNRLTVTVDAT